MGPENTHSHHILQGLPHLETPVLISWVGVGEGHVRRWSCPREAVTLRPLSGPLGDGALEEGAPLGKAGTPKLLRPPLPPLGDLALFTVLCAPAFS